MITILVGFCVIIYLIIYLILVAFGVVKPQPQPQKKTRRRTTRRTAPKTTYSTTRVTKVSTPKTHGITTTSTTQKRCSNCGCYVHVSANGAYECGYCANYYGGNK